MQLILATNNEDKIREMKQLLDDLPVTILTRDDFLEFPDIEETGSTLEENAILKATGIGRFCDMPALADDSGLEVDALDGAPGVHSARYSGQEPAYIKNNEKLIAELKNVPTEKRTARFRCVIAIDWGAGSASAVGVSSSGSKDGVDIVDGSVEGVITEDIGAARGFGYDPVFYYPPADKRFSEMTLEEKNLVSHRGLALQKARTLIIEHFNQVRE
ncbi:MAG: RdgB/HAM1 family non-canonical purine NTP pyrophosphatase [candidate division Zixibacteria bacterium]|nr:RdgB/HAM1 family non-canonical purine NTP pyrophosphatase [candidate division Zixibacteria bacterium]